MKGLYKLFNYSEQNILEVEYLTEIIQTLGVQKDADEVLFQFSPELVEEKTEKFNEHEPWALYHKRELAQVITLQLLEKIIPTDYDLEFEQNALITDGKYSEFVQRTDLRSLSKDEIIIDFGAYYRVYNEKLRSKI